VPEGRRLGTAGALAWLWAFVAFGCGGTSGQPIDPLALPAPASGTYQVLFQQGAGRTPYRLQADAALQEGPALRDAIFRGVRVSIPLGDGVLTLVTTEGRVAEDPGSPGQRRVVILEPPIQVSGSHLGLPIMGRAGGAKLRLDGDLAQLALTEVQWLHGGASARIDRLDVYRGRRPGAAAAGPGQAAETEEFLAEGSAVQGAGAAFQAQMAALPPRAWLTRP
jgi:hypothetical protein